MKLVWYSVRIWLPGNLKSGKNCKPKYDVINCCHDIASVIFEVIV